MKKYNILFVDDDPLVLKTAEIFLKHVAEKLILVNSGEKCLEILENDKQFDSILLDIMMPQIDGIKVLERIRQNPQTASLKVIIQTGMMNVNEKYIKKLGASFIFKPYTKTQLFKAIEESITLI
jgi:two-component system chemotaxis sensor kinase CheA